MSAPGRWQFWIDRGGTFTDIVGCAPDGSLHTAKLLSSHPGRYRDAAVEGMRRMLQLPVDAPITPDRVACVKMGTTVATNALLQRSGEPTVLVITRGFRDALRIGVQARPRIFDRHIVLPERLEREVIEARERVDAQGDVVEALHAEALRADLQHAFERGVRACAIVFVHGWRHPAHEAAAATIARSIGFTQVSTSHQTSPLMKLVPRGDTTVVDAYLSPILRRYVVQVQAEMPGVQLLFMQSSGGLVDADRFHGKDAILSGPAGGVVGMTRTATQAGHRHVIGFDMGGTSTDVSHFAGTDFERDFDTTVAGVRVRAPMMRIHTVAAGGGSIIRFDGGRLRVGPASAGADPGPACYRRDGPLTVTDANVLLGRIQPRHFPAVFGPAGDAPLDAEAARTKFAALAESLQAAGRPDISPESLALGALQITVANMANAIKRISVARGHDVTDCTLQCFGGAGGQHACAVADALGITRVSIHPLAGVLSAYGMGLADRSAMRQRSIEQPLDGQGHALAQATLTELTAAAHVDLRSQGVDTTHARNVQQAHLRYEGTDTALPLPFTDAATLCGAFDEAHQRRFAFLMKDRPLVIDAVSVEVIAPVSTNTPIHASATPTTHEPTAVETVRLFTTTHGEAHWLDAPLHVRATLQEGACIIGPALITETLATTLVEPGWQARVTVGGTLELRRIAAAARTPTRRASSDPVMLEVFNNLFMHIAEQMGLQLQNTASSVNIKERLDFSCAIFDADGQLIANAPHIPVHLGSMGESIRTVIERNPRMRPGDVFALNDPFHGGTHLPDVTVVTPVFLQPSDARPAFYTASRGHHADIGGITPGSMPPFSTSIDQEGVRIDNLLLVQNGQLQERAVLEHLLGAAHPARNPRQNLADLRAQIAANETGAAELRSLVRSWGLDTVIDAMRAVQDNAEACVRRAITQLHDGAFTLPLDSGAQIHVRITVDASARSATIDFTGTSAQLTSNFNAPRAVTMAAVLYVFRTLVDDDIPLNAGCLRPLRVIVPDGCMLNPHPPAAVVAGNVETSQCVTNALYGALGLMASGPSTMNNLTFGNASHQYYETIAGGSGAGPGFHGTAAVQTHMTNSRLTDPEVLETRYPVRVERHEIRADSGGAGQWRGGDGATRCIRFLQPMTVSILSNGRKHGAFGMAGGEAGAPGMNAMLQADGRTEPLGPLASVAAAAGDAIVIHTPGGGGYGTPTP